MPIRPAHALLALLALTAALRLHAEACRDFRDPPPARPAVVRIDARLPAGADGWIETELWGARDVHLLYRGSGWLRKALDARLACPDGWLSRAYALPPGGSLVIEAPGSRFLLQSRELADRAELEVYDLSGCQPASQALAGLTPAPSPASRAVTGFVPTRPGIAFSPAAHADLAPDGRILWGRGRFELLSYGARTGPLPDEAGYLLVDRRAKTWRPLWKIDTGAVFQARGLRDHDLLLLHRDRMDLVVDREDLRELPFVGHLAAFRLTAAGAEPIGPPDLDSLLGPELTLWLTREGRSTYEDGGGRRRVSVAPRGLRAVGDALELILGLDLSYEDSGRRARYRGTARFEGGKLASFPIVALH